MVILQLLKKNKSSDEIEKPSSGHKQNCQYRMFQNGPKKTFCFGCQKQEVNNKLCHNCHR